VRFVDGTIIKVYSPLAPTGFPKWAICRESLESILGLGS